MPEICDSICDFTAPTVEEHFYELVIFQIRIMAGVSTTDITNMTSKQFLDRLVVPQLLPALNVVSTARSGDLAEYLIKHKKTPDETASNTRLEEHQTVLLFV